MHGKFLFCAPGFQVQDEPLIQVLAPMIGMENFDGNAKVRRAPGIILLVGFKSFGFQVKQVEVSQSGLGLYAVPYRYGWGMVTEQPDP